MYMGETGHNTIEWQQAFTKVLQENNIGYTYWPYKKLEKETCMAIKTPENWDLIVNFANADRSTYGKIREARPDQKLAWKAMMDFIENCKFKNCVPQKEYIESIGLTCPNR